MSFRHRPLMTSVYEWHCSHACTLVMGRTLDLPSVIELAPGKWCSEEVNNLLNINK
jgi:hypothetical protein